VRRRKEKNDERKQQTNGKPWRSRITLRLKSPDVLSPRLHNCRAFAETSWLTKRQRHLTPGRGRIYKWLSTDGPVWSALLVCQGDTDPFQWSPLCLCCGIIEAREIHRMVTDLHLTSLLRRTISPTHVVCLIKSVTSSTRLVHILISGNLLMTMYAWGT
jgi:hypothetical protein